MSNITAFFQDHGRRKHAHHNHEPTDEHLRCADELGPESRQLSYNRYGICIRERKSLASLTRNLSGLHQCR